MLFSKERDNDEQKKKRNGRFCVKSTLKRQYSISSAGRGEVVDVVFRMVVSTGGVGRFGRTEGIRTRINYSSVRVDRSRGSGRLFQLSDLRPSKSDEHSGPQSSE